MAAYWTVLLSVLTTDIAGVRSEWQCNDTCCAGAFSLGSKKCEKLRPCSDTGQYIIRAGNETQDNKCWCDEGKRFSPIRPKLCWEKSEACGCLQCPEGTKPDLVDKNGQYVEHFDKDKHCKRMCEPTGNRIGDGIGIGIAISIGVFFVVLFIPWIYYCWRYKKCTFPFKFMTKGGYSTSLRMIVCIKFHLSYIVI
ncbi:uncharacterized protein LOC106175827 [Lingula anatina]|uniref:Uncharacterized protein LOC106175827 n=1 Tax=Lingula anatina TaxID=7574 RepID=A0A1S3JST6_LINAN|nr:uncharacterized protein LOC106175827 [Lingula anatina]|eukprot:XP_013413435.1 uncharacterized protein LOC106175827 [Lingula anatina]